jgi:hypothetical protein
METYILMYIISHGGMQNKRRKPLAEATFLLET